MTTSTPRYLYVASPGGKEDGSPCKIGISYNPEKRIYRIRANPYHFYEEEMDLVKVYECAGELLSTRCVENDYRDKFGKQTLPKSEEWFDFEAGLLVDEIDDDERCSAVASENM